MASVLATTAASNQGAHCTERRVEAIAATAHSFFFFGLFVALGVCTSLSRRVVVVLCALVLSGFSHHGVGGVFKRCEKEACLIAGDEGMHYKGHRKWAEEGVGGGQVGRFRHNRVDHIQEQIAAATAARFVFPVTEENTYVEVRRRGRSALQMVS